MTLAACSSTPAQYYTLLAPVTSTAAPAPAAFQIEVLAVDVPAQVDRPELVVREGAGQLAPVDTRLWIAPLTGELRTALSNDLAHRLGARDVYELDHDAALPTYRVKLSVQRFDSALGAYARIDAVWTLQRVGTLTAVAAPLASCSSSATEIIAPGYAELAEGHQRALGSIADQIAQSIRTAAATGSVPVCPAADSAHSG